MVIVAVHCDLDCLADTMYFQQSLQQGTLARESPMVISRREISPKPLLIEASLIEALLIEAGKTPAFDC
jgi:hypothetical protein